MNRLRLAGAEWRLLVHTYAGRGHYTDAHHFASNRRLGGGNGLDSSIELDDGTVVWSRHTELPGTEFDELVVGRWLHIEQMDNGFWWMNVGGVTVHVWADREGRPKHVMVHGPLDYADPVPGCNYECQWTDTSTQTREGEETKT